MARFDPTAILPLWQETRYLKSGFNYQISGVKIDPNLFQVHKCEEGLCVQDDVAIKLNKSLPYNFTSTKCRNKRLIYFNRID